MHSFVSGAVLSLAVASSAFAADLPAVDQSFGADPTGQTAGFTVDTDSDRTSSMVKSGSISSTVEDHVATGSDAATYLVNFDYNLNLGLLGKKSGTVPVHMPDVYFTPGFMPALRQSKHFESPQLKIDYIQAEDAKTADGHDYPNCDKIRVYDIEGDRLRDLVAAPYDIPLKNLVVVADVYPGVPALGAVKVDLTGNYQGINIKAGGDYNAP